jgi:hypothetical protein
MNLSARTLTLVAIALLTAGTAQAGKIYKSVDGQGNVTYSSKAPAKGSKATEVRTRRSHISDDTAQERLEALSGKATQRQKNRELLAGDAKAGADEDERRTKNCETAKKNLSLLQSSNRVQANDADGNPFVLSEEVKSKKLEESQAQIKEFCGS